MLRPLKSGVLAPPLLAMKFELSGIKVADAAQYERELRKDLDDTFKRDLEVEQERELSLLSEQICEIEAKLAQAEDAAERKRLRSQLGSKRLHLQDCQQKASYLAKQPTSNSFLGDSIFAHPEYDPQAFGSLAGPNYSAEDFEEDDFSTEYYRKRLRCWNERNGKFPIDLATGRFIRQPADFSLADDCSVPAAVAHRLYPYQRAGVRWLHALYRERIGGILADEMGLGKTFQVISFLAALFGSGQARLPALVVAPVTLLDQWVAEVHRFCPAIRVIIVHSGSARPLAQDESVLYVTSYSFLLCHAAHHFLLQRYSALFLDEGHRIRNAETAIARTCKQLSASMRVVLSGTPMQNNLLELWSLFDFCFPGRLGTLPIFQVNFATPIAMGGYSNASALQVQTAFECACALRSLIAPYMLRRVKSDVAQQLPAKTEQILFCKLTATQRMLYEAFLQSQDISAVARGERNLLAMIDQLRKICNHTELTTEGKALQSTPLEERSGKLSVLLQLLQSWNRDGHRVLIFCQTRQMLRLVERDAVSNRGWQYLKMDGDTAVHQRSSLVSEFNGNPQIFVFLLTTRVGGLGLNLTGADRVVIVDPDWNPQTDVQARERAWRLGQTRPVTILRFIVAGTLEEKIYHRQIFKQHQTDKILSDPRQARYFKASDLYDLFELSPESSAETETSMLFPGVEPCKPKDNILDSITKVTGIHSLFDHERLIQEGDKGRNQDIHNLRKQAELIAKRAICELKAVSREKIHLGGNVSASSALLQRISEETPGQQDQTNGNLVAQEIISMLHGMENFSTTSDALVSHFADDARCDATTFKAILKEVATFDKDTKVWLLKEQYNKARAN